MRNKKKYFNIYTIEDITRLFCEKRDFEDFWRCRFYERTMAPSFYDWQKNIFGEKRVQSLKNIDRIINLNEEGSILMKDPHKTKVNVSFDLPNKCEIYEDQGGTHQGDIILECRSLPKAGGGYHNGR